MKIGIDLDNTITASKESIEFFSIMTNLLIAEHRIYVITNREPDSEKEIGKELKILGIQYSEIVITAEKADYIKQNGITIFFEDSDRYFLELGERVVVFKVREEGNFSFAEKKWITSRRNSIVID
jgi:uncharacterized HAD superfamily protein